MDIDWEKIYAYFASIEFGMNSPTSTDWTDKIFLEKYVILAKVEKKVELSASLVAAKTLLNWYVSGTRPEHISDKILAVFYNMTILKDILLFPEYLYEGGPALKPPEENVSMISDLNYSNPSASKGSAASMKEGDIKIWYNTIWLLLDAKDNLNKNRIGINFIGFLYMNLFRVTVKSTLVVSKHISKNTLSSFTALWKKIPNLRQCYPPTSIMLNDFEKLFKKQSSDSNRCLSAMVYAMGNCTTGKIKQVRAILRAGCLLSLAEVGLGVLHWTQKAAKAIGCPVLELIEYMNTIQHKSTNEALNSLLTNYALDMKEYSWPWARMFSDGAFLELSTKRSPLYTMIMVSLSIGNQTDNDMWNIPSLNVKYKDTRKKEAIERGKIIMKRIAENKKRTTEQ